MRTAAIVLALVVVAGIIVLRRYNAKRRKTLNQQSSISAAVSTIRAQDSVIASAVSALALVHSLYAAAIAKVVDANPGIDTTELDAATAEAQAATTDLTNAIAANTPASDEVHVDNGGTGTDSSGTVVDPAQVDTTAVTAPVDDGSGGAASGGADASGSGAAASGGDAGAGVDTSATGAGGPG